MTAASADHFVGSNTATGTGPLGGFYSNKLAIEAAKKHDMGMFIISPTDKGAQLYMPPKKFADACEPLSPIEFNNLCTPFIYPGHSPLLLHLHSWT